MHFNLNEFTQFTVQAKLNTYASEGDEATVIPTLNGSKQLEFLSGDYFYRDIYFGMEHFIGQEIIEYMGSPIWSMVYSGGIIQRNLSNDQVGRIYQFLRNALKLVSLDEPFRGPEIYEEENLVYVNKVQGDINNFSGFETIYYETNRIYDLRYSGGFII